MNYRKKLFEGVQPKRPNKNTFELNHEWKHDFALGKMIPVLCEPVMPGDEFSIETEFRFTFSPLYFPSLQIVNMVCNYFYVPNRIVWRTTSHQSIGALDGWEAFISMSQEIEAPRVNAEMQLTSNGEANDLVLGYMGLPYIREAVGYDDTIPNINCIPLSMYVLISDCYYRNEFIEPGRWYNLVPGDNTSLMDAAFIGYNGNIPTPGRYRVFSSKWEKDYFTSAIPSPQQGDPVKIPMTEFWDDGEPAFPYRWIKPEGGTVTDGAMTTQNGGETRVSGQPAGLDIQTHAADTAQLRVAMITQWFKERLAKIGFGDYFNYIKGMFGNKPEPGAIDRPIWFGYYSAKVKITDVETTANTTLGEQDYTTGQFAGRAFLHDRSPGHNIYCGEHGFIIAIMEVKPNANYGQGIERWWRWALPTDYPMDIFAGIGDQEIKREELFYNNKAGKGALNDETFGYIPRYSEMRFRSNRFGTNLTVGATQEWARAVHMGRLWSPGIMENDDQVRNYLTLGTQFTDIRKHLGDGWPYPQYSGETGSIREADSFKLLTLPYNLGTTSNPIQGHLFHRITVRRNLPMYSTPTFGI